MKRKGKIVQLGLFILLTAGLIAFTTIQNSIDDKILAYTVDPKTQNLQLYWKNDKGERLKSIQNLKKFVESKNGRLTFAMNGGMFIPNFAPQGLYIKTKKRF